MYAFDVSYIKRDQSASQTKGRRYKLKKQRANKKQRETLMRFRAVNSLNMLPSDIAEAPSLNNAFKSRSDRVWRQYQSR